MDHETLILRGWYSGAILLGDAAPALKFVGVGWAGGDAGPIVVVVPTRHARRAVVRCRAAS